jgi:probable rRNA maturation factor|tara:strand:+ start:730 stop:1176 length:447 start_codon:yes stop_codon:yes gene_type:complete
LSLNIIQEHPDQLPEELIDQLSLLATHILNDYKKNDLEINLKLVSSDEMTALNQTYRNKTKDTNVLSFPTDPEVIYLSKELGDIAICVPFMESEAKTLNRSKDNHMMHLVTHGVLHLLGLDHANEKDANLMESHEISYLKKFNISNPY